MRGQERTHSHSHSQGQGQQGRAGGLQFEARVQGLAARLEARADARDAAQLRQDVVEARGFVKGWDAGGISQDTQNRYQSVVQAMKNSGERPEQAACKSTFEFRRAALIHTTRDQLKMDLRALDKARRSGDLAGAARAYASVKTGLATLRQYPPSTGSREADLQRRSAYSGPARPAAEASNGKRESLKNLPQDWRDRVQRAVNQKDKAAVAAMALTGCRPAEVRGIKVRQHDNKIIVEVRGAKVDDDRGVEKRTIELDKEDLQKTEAGRDLADWLGNRDCRTVTHEGSLNSFRERVSRAADRAGLQGVSAYSFRHQKASDLKNSGADREEIARTLGHRSSRSQSVYG